VYPAATIVVGNLAAALLIVVGVILLSPNAAAFTTDQSHASTEQFRWAHTEMATSN